MLLLGLALACSRTPPEPVPPPESVLLITVDTLRADHLGTYGYKLARTPRIDALASDGVRLDDHATSAPITMPAHTSLMTGLWPPAHGVRDNGNFRASPALSTWAERMKAAGYETHAFVSAAVLDSRYGLDQGFDTYDDDLASESAPPAEDEVAQIVNFGIDCTHLDDQCNAGEYDPKLEACVAMPANEGGKCDDGMACTLGDVCGVGACAGTEAAEVTGDGIDQDCDVGEICFSDADDDGHAAKDGATVVSADADCDDATEATNADPADDCDDTDPGAYPGATEIANDDVDQDCDGVDLVETTDDTGGGDDGGGDDGGGDDAGGDGGGSTDDGDDDKGCSHVTGSAPAPLWVLALGMLGLAARRRRA